MFDGNHRVPRRAVNLSGDKRKMDKKSILQQSRIRREERRIAAERAAACTTIQRCWRACDCRRKLVRVWTAEFRTALESRLAEVEATPLLNGLLRLQKGKTEIVTPLLKSYASAIQSKAWRNHAGQSHPVVLSTLHCLPHLESIESLHILQYTMHLQSKTAKTTKGLPHASSYYWHRLGANEGLTRAMEVVHLQPFLQECIQAALPDTLEGKAVSGAIALCSGAQPDTALIFPLLHILQQDTATTMEQGTTEQHGIVTKSTIRRLVSKHASKIMTNLLAIDDNCKDANSSSVCVQFCRALLLHNSPALVWTLNRIVKGELVASDESQLEDHDSDDEEETNVPTNVATKSHKTKSSYRYSRSDLLTTPKLDRLFASHIDKIDSLLNTNQQSLATKLGSPDLWIRWGDVLMNDDTHRNAQDDYVTILAIGFQATTGLRPRQNASSSKLLNKLAFSSSLLERLWNFVVRQLDGQESVGDTIQSPIAYLSMSLFCDLFAHHLIVLNDEQFIEKFTSNSDRGIPCIDATDVIVRLRSILYDLYWTKPVLTTDLKVVLGDEIVVNPKIIASSKGDSIAAARARLLLTGTKLWNSLYERWCRQVRQTPFSEESVWWFPTVISGGAPRNRAVLLDRRRRPDNMDVSGSDSDSDVEMEVADVGDALAEVFSDPKIARLLSAIPQALPFDRRVKMFDSLLHSDKARTQDDSAEMREAMLAMMRGVERDAESSFREKVAIRRDRLYSDSMDQLNELGKKLKRKIQVSFTNQHGVAEAGIDGGGVFKEFIDDLIKDAFAVEGSTATHQLFSVTPTETLAVNTDLKQEESLLPHYEFLGRVLGKAVYESILVEPQFCLPFLNQLVGKANSIEDMKNLDLEYYRNLTKLLTLTTSDLENMGLTFELTVWSGKSARNVELMPGGRSISVTKTNVIQYMHLVSHHRLNVQSIRQTKAFLNGFRDLIPASWVRLFSAHELQKLISGDDSIQGIDVESLKRSMQYAAGYHPSQPVMKWFWEIVEDLSVDEQHKFLKFMTSCSRQPLLGFESLEPAPCVQQINLPDSLFVDESTVLKRAPLPTSSTCMNLLKLPNYRSKELMRQKLIAAIESGAGFELT